MGYIEDNLMPGEQILYRARIHWAIFLFPAILGVLGIVLVLSSFKTDNLVCFAWFILLLAISAAFSTTVAYMTTEFALTDRRVIAKAGLIRRRSVDLLLTKVESIGVRQSIGGRILNFGTVTVTGTGGTKEPFGSIADPMELRRRVQTQIATNP